MRRLSADGLDPTLMRRERTDSTGEVIPATVEKPLREAELLFEEQLESMQDAPAGPFGSLRRRSRRTQSAAATEYDTCDDYDDDDAYDEDYEDDDDDDGRAAPEERDRVKSDRHTRRRGGHHEQLGHNKRRSWEDVDALWCPVTHPWGEARTEVKVFEKPDAETKRRLRARVAASPALAALEAAPRTAVRRWRLLKNTVLAVGALNDIVRQSREIHSDPVCRGSLRSHLKSWGVAADTQKQLVVPWFVFQPDDPTRVAWDTASALVMLMMIFYIPYNVSFVGPTYVYYVFDWFLTVFFTVDICLSFVTAYEHKGRTVTDPSKIARHYLRTFFLLDVVATFPMDIALAGRTKDKHKDLGRLAKASKLPRMFRYVRVFRFMRIVRVYGMDGIIQRAMVRAQLNPGMVRMCQIVIVALVGAHLFACFWYSLGTTYENEHYAFDDCHAYARHKQCTWIQMEGLSRGDGNFFLYMVSLYWALTTITTVGFGDVVPNTADEMVYTCFVMVMGVTWYAVLITTVGKIFHGMDSKASDRSARSKTLNAFIHKHKISAPLAAAMHQHLRHQFEVGHGWRDEESDASKLISSLSKPLHRILALHLERKLIAKIPLFAAKPRLFVADAVIKLVPLLSAVGEVVLQRDEVADAVHFVVSGEVAVRVSSVPGARQLARLRAGSYFGDEGCLLGAHWKAILCGGATTEMQLIKKPDLSLLLATYTDVARELVAVATERLRRCSLLSTATPVAEAQAAHAPHLRSDSTTSVLSAADPASPGPPRRAVGCGAFVLACLDDGNWPPDRSDEAARLRAALRRRALALDAAPAAAPPPPPPDDDDDARLAAEAAYLYEERLVAGAVHDARFLSPSSRRALASELLSLVASAASPTPAGKSRRRSSHRASSQDAAKDEG